MICLAQITVLLGEGGKASDVDEGSDGGSDVVILRMVVKPLWDVASNNTNPLPEPSVAMAGLWLDTPPHVGLNKHGPPLEPPRVVV